MPTSQDKQLSQAELVAFLLNPASYPHRPKSIRLIQTHAAYVAVVPPYVYKVKKDVHLGFLDYSTLPKRKYALEREIQLNRRLCADLYLGMSPIALRGTGLHFGEGGRIVEYAIKMKKLSDRGFLLYRVQKDRADKKDISRIVNTLTPFYQSQTGANRNRSIGVWGRVEKLKYNTDENFLQTEGFVGTIISQSAYEAIRQYTDTYYDRHGARFESRIQDGWMVDGHGDLHLEHIHLTPKRLRIYDCIEFNDRFRYLDVANDIAFLAMDLDFYGRPDLARFLVSEMAASLDDGRLQDIVVFYACYRAYIRGKVAGIRSRESEIPVVERQQSKVQAQQYFRLALQYAAIGCGPTVIVVMGRIGSGKSTLAAALAKALDWPSFSSDRMRKEQAGLPARGRSDDAVRRLLYTQVRTQTTYDGLLACAISHLTQGHPVILDATFGNRADRDRLREQVHDKKATCLFIEAVAPESLLRKRLEAREGHPDEISDARLDDFEAVNRKYTPPEEVGTDDRLSISTDKPLEDTLKALFANLVERHVNSI